MKLIIAIEGGDGTGKSTLSNHLESVCLSHGLSFRLIGRTAQNSSEAVARLSEVINWSGSVTQQDKLSAEADVYLRVSREYQRILLAQTSSANVVLFDRFVLSDLSRAIINSCYSPELEQVLVDIIRFAQLDCTIFCDCPFDIAWDRVHSRGELSNKEKLGEQYNRRLFEIMKAEFEAGKVTSRKIAIRTSTSLEDSKDQLSQKIWPLLAGL